MVSGICSSAQSEPIAAGSLQVHVVDPQIPSSSQHWPMPRTAGALALRLPHPQLMPTGALPLQPQAKTVTAGPWGALLLAAVALM
jgi:hypothetical protein